MADPAPGITILAESEAEDHRLLALIRFFDLSAKIVRRAGRDLGTLFGQLSENDRCLITSARFLTVAVRDEQDAERFRSFVSEGRRQILVYGETEVEGAGDGVRRLTMGAFRSVPQASRMSAEGYRVSPGPRELTRQLSGLSLDDDGAVVFPGLAPEAGDRESQVLISRGGVPVFLSTKLGGQGTFFILAHQDIADIHQGIKAPWSLRPLFLGLIPIIMFFRSALQDAFWEAPHAYANLTIDDPLLRNPYGFMDYERLLSVMDLRGFYTTVAFIPRNLRRSREDTCRLIRQRPDRYGLCVHGLSHTRHEFGGTDPRKLTDMAWTSLRLMREHERRTRLSWDNVMVFPQGRFSANAMRALKYGGFAGAVNSIPESADDQGELRLLEMIEPAHLKYDDFPLFLRRYPVDASDFAIDLFLGRPAIMVEHQGWFRTGYDHVGEFVDRVNALDRNLLWRGLGDIVLGSYWRRTNGPLIEVRVFGGRVRIENEASERREFLVKKAERAPSSVDSVTINGTPIDYAEERDGLRFRFELPPGKTAVLDILYRDPSGGAERTRSLKEARWAAIRRYLAAFRDHAESQRGLLAEAVSGMTRRYRACRRQQGRVASGAAEDRTDGPSIREGGEG